MAGEGSPKPTMNIDDGFDFDPNAYNLPFQSRLLDDALGFPPPNEPDDLTLREKLAWLESPSMLPLLRKWRAEVFDPKEIRAQIEHVCPTDFSNVSDMINSLIGLCFAALGGQKPSHNGAFEATACTAATLVSTNDNHGSLLEGMEAKCEVYWASRISCSGAARSKLR